MFYKLKSLNILGSLEICKRPNSLPNGRIVATYFGQLKNKKKKKAACI